ncbi:hypothetical protein GN958_ATG21247 [Phytophthora infestans]|uniref:Uncharacterized protein n=1 Tax=Phytophthora infestans TaxID=4787 RepID=A0A8S9TM84_PHYIN|nr:hypothetical protein GN958_ATG21247 [Phytophthora infestans]
MAPGELDQKAIAIWAAMPGVEYELCVSFDPNFANAEYKLYDARVHTRAAGSTSNRRSKNGNPV